MRSLLFIAATLIVFSTGCVPVTEPLSDITKAEPDKNLVGAWKNVDDGAKIFVKLTIDVPEVKGNPKGLMREVEDDPNHAVWFYTTKIGKHNYATLIAGEKFATEGDFVKWQKQAAKRYYIFRYTVDGDKLIVDTGSDEKVEQIMKDAKIENFNQGVVRFYNTPAGWLTKYLDKNGAAKIFDGTSKVEFRKVKQK